MKVLILGAGIAGVTAAYTLASRGHEVEVVDLEPGAGRATSFANGGQLSYSHALPWANPGVFPKLWKWMFKDDAPLVLRPSSDPAMIRWGLMFLWNCMADRAERHHHIMLRLALYSREKMKQMREDSGVQFHYLNKGILHVLTNEKDFEEAQAVAKRQESWGCHEDVLTPEQCIEKEPALKHAQRAIVGGMFSSIDESGDIHLFCTELEKVLREKYKVNFRYGENVKLLAVEGDRVSGVATDKGSIGADAVVMAMGSWSTLLLKKVGINLPMYPMKGYSITLPAWDGAPHVSITDDEKKIVISRLGDRVRAAGTAEFARYDVSINEKRIAPLVNCIKELFPVADVSDYTKWACIRPQTPDGPPIIGKTKYKNLYLHTGHGTLGWTQSAGTATLLADIIEGRPTDIPLDGLELTDYRVNYFRK